MQLKSRLSDFYQLDCLWKIVNEEDKKGKLKKNYFSNKVKDKSSELKKKRNDFNNASKIGRAYIKVEIDDIKTSLDELKKNEVAECFNTITNGKAQINITVKKIKNHEIFITDDLITLLVSQIIKLELRRSYRLRPANRDIIIEQIGSLLDNPMPKTIIRADIQSFFESIPQNSIITKLNDDGFISKRTLKYLKRFMYEYNSLKDKKQEKGVPRGLAFSSYLAELYLYSIDNQIKNINGVYFYSRYVDDIIIVADPNIANINEYWVKLSDIVHRFGLDLHESSTKKFLQELDTSVKNTEFEYLGYCFCYSNSELKIKLSSKRFNKYKSLIDLVFNSYAKSSHFRRGKDKPKEERILLRCDSLSLFIKRLRILTSNGMLSGRKNYVATGVYYSNKFLTDFSQLKDLDHYLINKINDVNSFNPPSSLFNYNNENNYNKNIALIKKMISNFSFIKGFENRKLHKTARYSKILSDLQKLYLSNMSNNE